MLAEKEKAYIYRDLVSVNNSYYKLLVDNKFEKYPEIEFYLKSTSEMLEQSGMDLNLNWYILEHAKLDSNSENSERFVRLLNEIDKCSEPVRKLVCKNVNVFQRIIKVKNPKLYRLIIMQAQKTLLRDLLNILKRFFESKFIDKFKKIEVYRSIEEIFRFNEKIYNKKGCQNCKVT